MQGVLRPNLEISSGDFFLDFSLSRFHYKLGCLFFPEATEEKEFCLNMRYSPKYGMASQNYGWYIAHDEKVTFLLTSISAY